VLRVKLEKEQFLKSNLMNKTEVNMNTKKSVTIEPIVDKEKYRVNGHLVYKNQWSNWSCEQDLSDGELWAFTIYEKLIIKNPKIKKHTKALYSMPIKNN
jgi:lipopolysaccharide biosynthesis protein